MHFGCIITRGSKLVRSTRAQYLQWTNVSTDCTNNQIYAMGVEGELGSRLCEIVIALVFVWATNLRFTPCENTIRIN